MAKKPPRTDPLPRLLGLVDALISGALAAGVEGLTEGDVLSSGPAPYRRLDCDGRALAYVRARPRKRAVRVDVTGLWRAPVRSKLTLPNAGGAASMLLRTPAEVREAVRFLATTVERTRRHEAEQDRRHEAMLALLEAERAEAAAEAEVAGADSEAA